MRGPLFVASCAALVLIIGGFLDGEDRPMENLGFALFLFGGLGCFGAWGYFHGMTGPYTALLVVFLLAVLTWGYRLDEASKIARAQWAQYLKGKGR